MAVNPGIERRLRKRKEVKRKVDKPNDYLRGSLTSGEKYTAWDDSEGYVKPDMGKKSGAAIPYHAVKRRHDKQYKNYTVPNPDWYDPDKAHWERMGRGDTVSELAAKYGMSWQDLWSYNLRDGVRPEETQDTLRQRGPHLTYKGSAFRIPTARWAAIQRRNR